MKIILKSLTKTWINYRGAGQITNFWDALSYGHLWQFGSEDFKSVLQDVKTKQLLDDKFVALSLAFRIYYDNKHPAKWKEWLKKTVKGMPDLEQQLDKFLNPPPQSAEEKKWKQQEARWKRQSEQRKLRDIKARAEWGDKLRANLGWIDNTNVFNLRGQITQAQSGLHQCMQEKHNQNSGHWTDGNWQGLIEEFGREVATSFRNGMVAFWRHYKPKLRSEDDTSNGTPICVIFGLSGLEIESIETPAWPNGLTDAEAELAFRYAFHELNGFPNWFHKLFNGFPDIGKRILQQEIEWEINTSIDKQERYYLLCKIRWNDRWLWPHIADTLFGILQKREPNNIKSLDYILKIIQGSDNIRDNDIAALAKMKYDSFDNTEYAPYWFAIWIGVDPASAIPYFSNYLSSQSFDVAKNIAMQTIVQLVGERRLESGTRGNFKTPEYLKNLYILMHQYVRIEDDIHRAGGGVYSPTLRDDAQDARNRLFSMLTEIKGKAAYLAQMALAESHPNESQRTWMLQHAKSRAQQDAESEPWKVKEFCEFRDDLERTPKNHIELYQLAVQRLLDFKHECEEGDNSNSQILIKVTDETKIRNYIAGWCRDKAVGRYSVPQEDELADAKRPDIRFYGAGLDAPVPVELKLVDNNWSGPQLFERLENQLCGDYLRDSRSNCGIFLLIYQGEKQEWELPDTKKRVNFEGLIDALKEHWSHLSKSYPKIESIEIIGIDLTKRTR